MIQMPQTRFDVIAFKGGLDQVTPTLGLKPGVCKQASNFECSVYGGYTRIAGYERFDGRSSPSAATQSMVFVATMLIAPSVGDTLTGSTSGASGVVAAVENGYIVITKQSLVFTVGEMALVGATNIGLVTSQPGGPVSAQENAIHIAAAADIYRADIGAVPGSGPVRGVFLFDDILYAFRDNAGATAVGLYKSSASGWVNVPYYYEVSFTAGTNEPAEGDTLTQGGVTSTIKRVCTESNFNAATGAWAAGTATGRFIISAPSGGNFAAGAATAGGATTITLSGAQTAISFLPGGKFETIKENFSGGLSTFRVYGCDGENRAWEFDGNILAPISTGNGVNDKPKHIYAHKESLFLGIQTSVFKSAPGLPFCYTAINGAVEFAIGDTVTGMVSAPGTQTSAALFIFGRSNTAILYGTNATDFNLVTYNTGTGAIDYSIQNMAQTLAMDDRGAIMLQTSLNYGNFDQATLTHNIRPYLDARRTRLSCSMLNRSKGQYRIFFSDGYGLYITIVNGKWIGSMPTYFKHVPYCAIEDKYSNGDDASFFGGTDGYVYQLDKGTSFDGQNIYAYMTLNYAASGNSRVLKSYRKAAMEVQGGGYAAFRFGYSLGYGSDAIPQPANTAYGINFNAPYWGSFTWGNFYWGGRSLMPSECSMSGTAENVALAIYSDANYYQPFTLNTAIIHYLPRRALR